MAHRDRAHTHTHDHSMIEMDEAYLSLDESDSNSSNDGPTLDRRPPPCSFCHKSTTEPGFAICHCDAPYNYAHEICFSNYLFQTGRRTCKNCSHTWRCDPDYYAHILKQWRYVRIHNGVVILANIIILIIILASIVLTIAFGAKGLIYATTASVEYTPFGVPLFHVRLEPSLGDFVVGGLSLTIVVALMKIISWIRRKACCQCVETVAGHVESAAHRRPRHAPTSTPLLTNNTLDSLMARDANTATPLRASSWSSPGTTTGVQLGVSSEETDGSFLVRSGSLSDSDNIPLAESV